MMLLRFSCAVQDKRRPNLDNYLTSESPIGQPKGFLGSMQAFIAEAASNIPTGACFLALAEQESAMTAEVGVLEECLLQGISEEKDLAAAFLLIFIRGFKR